MINIQKLNSLDEALVNEGGSVIPLYYIEPLNEAEEKEAFLAGKTRNPQFRYRDLEYDPQKVARGLESIEIPDGELGKIYGKKKRNVLLFNEIIANRGDGDLVRENSIIIHGVPSDELVYYANELLRQIPNVEHAKNVSARSVQRRLQKALCDYGLNDWNVELTDKRLTSTYAGQKKISLCRNRKFAKIDPERLSVHEVGVHALRAANGYEQPLKIFALGLPGYSSTEEGLTSYFEEVSGNSNEETMRDYAARVISVDSVCQNLTFRQAFDRLKSSGLTDNQAWNSATRAYRGGGYVKDHIYLKGYREVKEFGKNSGDFGKLYVGKVGIEDLPLVDRLLEEGVLTEAKYKPDFIE